VKAKPKRDRVATIAAVGREQASSVDGTLLAGGLALFVLVLADTVLLTLSTGIFRGARA
jgi:hypothetical protein